VARLNEAEESRKATFPSIAGEFSMHFRETFGCSFHALIEVDFQSKALKVIRRYLAQ